MLVPSVAATVRRRDPRPRRSREASARRRGAQLLERELKQTELDLRSCRQHDLQCPDSPDPGCAHERVGHVNRLDARRRA